MGFSTVAATAILLVAFLFAGSVMASAIFESQRVTARGLDIDRDMTEHRMHTSVSIINGAYVPFNILFLNLGGNLYLNITNDGDTVLEADQTQVIVDGEWRTSDIVTREVDDGTTNIWAPGQRLFLKVTLDGFLGLGGNGAPERALVVAETGTANGLWTPA